MNNSVCEILLSKHGVNVRPGQHKIQCPFCGHKTLEIKPDDTLAKCFHPSCGKFVSAHENGRAPKLYGILEEMFRDCRTELQKQEKDNSPAWRYLTEERKIHPHVVNAADIGVIPAGYDVERLFSVVETVESDMPVPPKRGRSQAANSNIDYEKIQLEEAHKKLKGDAAKFNGCICFFHRDAAYRICSIIFRKPYSKGFGSFKPFRWSGVFGAGMFKPEGSVFDDKLLVHEGQFNALQLQSLSIRMGYTFVNTIAIGSSSSPDWGTVKRLSQSPLIMADNDDAGKAMVEKAREIMTIEVATIPGKPGADVDYYIRGFGEENAAAWEGVKELVKNSVVLMRPFDKLAEDICNVRKSNGKGDKRREHEINGEVARIVVNDFAERGKFYHDAKFAYYFRDADKLLMPIHAESDMLVRLLAKYGLLKPERIFNFIVESVRVHAHEKGAATEAFKFSHYDRKTFRLYIHNGNKGVFRVSANSIDHVDNGSDGVLFLADSKYDPFTFKDDVTPDAPFSWLDKNLSNRFNFSPGTATEQDRRLIFNYWIYSLFFVELLPTRPIVAFVGEKGSGKTSAIRATGKLLFGNSFDVMPLPSKEDDFVAAITNNFFIGIDNADSKCAWLPDRLATIATGAAVQKRILFTTNDNCEFPVRCHVAITSRMPHFSRDDVADRLLLMPVKRFDKFIPEKKIINDVLNHRDNILSDMLRKFQRIIAELQNPSATTESCDTFRLADFAQFAATVARTEGKGGLIEDILKKFSCEQSDFTLEGDDILENLQAWLKETRNAGRFIENKTLCAELAALSLQHGEPFSYAGRPRPFGQRMSAIRSNLEQHFLIQQKSIGGNRKAYSYDHYDTDEVVTEKPADAGEGVR